MPASLDGFAAGLASLKLTEVEKAEALLWFLARDGAREQTTAYIAQVLHDHALRGAGNLPRFATNLGRSKNLMRGAAPGTFKIRATSRDSLEQRFGGLVEAKPPEVQDDTVLVLAAFKGTRAYIESLARQVNGAYQFGFYDAAGVMCRRLMETLLISAFEHAGHGEAIKHEQDYKQLAELVRLAQSGALIRLTKNSRAALDEVKLMGDTAAHHRTHITSKTDIDDRKAKLRVLLSELMHLAKIEPKTT